MAGHGVPPHRGAAAEAGGGQRGEVCGHASGGKVGLRLPCRLRWRRPTRADWCAAWPLRSATSTCPPSCRRTRCRPRDLPSARPSTTPPSPSPVSACRPPLRGSRGRTPGSFQLLSHNSSCAWLLTRRRRHAAELPVVSTMRQPQLRHACVFMICLPATQSWAVNSHLAFIIILAPHCAPIPRVNCGAHLFLERDCIPG